MAFIDAISNYTPHHSTNTKIKSSSQPDLPMSFAVRKFTKTYKDLDANYLQSTWTVEDYSVMESSESESVPF